MALGTLRRGADARAAEAATLHAMRDARLGRGLAILEQRVGSPAGLAACFAAGFLAGSPRRRSVDGRGAAERRRAGSDRAGSVLAGPLATAAIRLASAFLTGAVAGTGAAAGSGTAAGDAAAGPPQA